MLRLVNKQRVHSINACDTVFKIISMSIGEKEILVHQILNIDSDTGEKTFQKLLDIITPAIIEIEGYDISVREVLSKLEDIDDFRTIVKAIIAHCSLTTEEVKNSNASSEQVIPVSAGNVEKTA